MSRRVARVSEAIRQTVSESILFELSDPRIKGVTVTGAEVAGDLRHAKIFVSIMGDETQQRLALSGLKSACGFLQCKVAQRLETRYTPVLDIVIDAGVKRSLEMSRLLEELLPGSETEPQPEPDDQGGQDVEPGERAATE